MDAPVLIGLGDLRVTVALAGAIFAWLVAGRSLRVALWWVIAFGTAMATVAASKILYLGWGVEVAAVDFKAASGHAAGVAAVLPVTLYLLAQPLGGRRQHAALSAGWLIGLAVAMALIVHGEHAPAEALVGWCIGALASTLTWRVARHHPPAWPAAGHAIVVAGLAILLAVGMQSVPAGWWMVKTALALSGAASTHRWNNC